MTSKSNSNKEKSTIKISLPLASLLATLQLASLFAVLFLSWQLFRIAPETRNYLQLRGEVLNLISQQSIRPLPSQDKIDDYQIKGLVASLTDPYSDYLDKEDIDKLGDSLNQRYSGVGIKFEYKNDEITVNRVFSDSPAERADIRPGDVLVSVNDQMVGRQTINQVAEKIRGENGTKLKLTVQRNNENLNKELTRAEIASELIFLDFKDDVAIIEISSFGNNLDSKMNTIAEKIVNNSAVKRIIIDLRGNSGGLLDESIEVMSYFTPPNEVAVIEKEKTKKTVLRTKPKDNSLQNYPLQILIDENSASASEILAGGLRDIKGAQLIGRKTFGKGVVQRIFTLSNKNQLKLTIAEWLTPKEISINQNGLEPDVKVESPQNALDKALSIK